MFWSIRKSGEVLGKLMSRGFCATSLPMYDFTPTFYADLVYNLIKIMGRIDFSDQFRKILIPYKRIAYNLNA